MAVHRMQQVSRGALLPAMAFTFVVLLADTVKAVAFDCLGLEVSYIHYQRVLRAMAAANLISTEEVAKHNAPSDCWVSIKTSSLCLAG